MPSRTDFTLEREAARAGESLPRQAGRLSANWIIALPPPAEDTADGGGIQLLLAGSPPDSPGSRMANVPRLSIVIPCVGGAAEFDGTLVSVLQHRPADCEVVVLHTEQYDDPYDLQGEVEFRRSQHQTVVELVNEGLAAATGDIVHVLGCGVEATEGWADAALPHFDDPQVATVSP